MITAEYERATASSAALGAGTRMKALVVTSTTLLRDLGPVGAVGNSL
jgi:hypothetical protein